MPPSPSSPEATSRSVRSKPAWAALLATLVCPWLLTAPTDSARAQQPAPVHDCDRLAQPPRGEMGSVPAYADGVPYKRLDKGRAAAACAEAMAQWPEEARFPAYAIYAASGPEYLRLVRLAASKGHPLGQYWMAREYFSGSSAVPRDDKQALGLFRLAAEAGLALAQDRMASIYQQGILGLPRDEEEAVRWTRRAADAGYAEAQFKMGASYLRGEGGLPRDDGQAVQWMQRAAEGGVTRAQMFLGEAYQYGARGLSKDAREAARWYRLAADQGDDIAKSRLETLTQP